MKRYSLLFFLLVVLSGCSKYGYVRLQYPTPPQAYLPENVHTLAVANRSVADEAGQSKATVEAVLTGEVGGSDKLASEECLRGVFDSWNGTKDLSIVFTPAGKLFGTGTQAIPPLLDWQVVKQVCESSQADALLVLEMFDSNSDLVAENVITQVDAATKGSKAPASSKVNMEVVSFWRLYDPVNKKLVDEFKTASNTSFDLVDRALNLPGGKALTQMAHDAGQQYSSRFFPGSYYVKREFFKKGNGSENEQFLAAFRKSEVADWDGASQIWQQLKGSADRTNAGRAYLNLAVASEEAGDTQKALELARKAYTDYGIKTARDYANDLQNRLNME